ncbi:STAS domain-containing protein [Mycolicibacterium sp.]|uniref:STAS domain-containing protein n=1 Tax=Mycolicibacterium sp. TaxID=2320850 RepID=UPI0028AA8E82|nr:STAS domain-containing protein [Mycolicibacterium sp.]
MTEARFAVTVASQDNPPLVVVSGDIDLANVNEFQNAMTKACNGSHSLTVDLTAVSYCDSAAVRALFSLAATTELTMVVKPTGHITTLLAISGLDRVASVVRAE